ncbi:cytochrome c [Rhodovulum iodosum]|uniref:Cytochrome c n=1 Tax=Rhodovulum iodosum TaxID=68291 RepID=A0ABV3XRV7_9RHOB|nr:c-type cytochrome [Rhodovulum robiginosum]RSK31519.1 c-type cytochrome [Rhodovulum robiginosum]
MGARALILSLAMALPAGAEGFRTFDGHGGPVMGLAVSADGSRALTASFDYSVGLWDVARQTPPRWLEGHNAAVNSVAFMAGGRAVSAGDDFDVLIWDLATARVLARLTGHAGKVMSARPSPDGTLIASASWDGTIRLWDVASGTERAVLRGHDGPVNDVAWAAGGTRLYSAGYDGTVVLWDVAERAALRRVASHAFGVNVLAIDESAGWLAYGALDGGTRVIDLDTGAELADLTAERRPILALARAPGGRRIAVGDGQGYIMVVDTSDWTIERDFRAAANGPVWALAFTGDGAAVIAGGIADQAYLWPLDGADNAPRMAEIRRRFHTAPGEVSNGERQFLRKCSVCHTLGPDGGRRAGPSLYGLFGRPAGTLPGYSYSPALENSDIIWSSSTIDKLFEIGPDHVTPGSKMPMQKIVSPADRADLIAFLKRETATE